ncbi:MAG: hypothetical protein GY943_29195, partial [Chloroflexi bacterium]|nr:hypothetical protein [Chloroflexota bacterium]
SLYQKVGIDPTGGTDWQSDTIIWSDARMQYDEFGLFAVEAVAEANTITVFMHSVTQVPVKHNDVYWDNAVVSLHKAVTTSTNNIFVMADVDVPQIVTKTIDIEITPSLNWTVVLDPGGTITPTLSTTASSSSETIAVTIDTTGLPLGTFSTNLTVSAGDGVTNSPIVIPITVVVVPDVFNT